MNSRDLGPATDVPVRITAALKNAGRPERLMRWADRHDMSVRWRAGDTWAVLEGAAPAVGRALVVEIRNFQGRRGHTFYASPQQPAVPAAVAGEVAELGRILSYLPPREARPWPLPREVPDKGLTPEVLRRTYNVTPLLTAGATGKGVTVVVFAFDGFDQSDLDTFASSFGLAQFTPEVVGGVPVERRGEAVMDLEAVHAVAPDAAKVLVNARPTVEAGGSTEKIAAMMEDADRRFPGAVWSLSIGWGCDKLLTAADLLPVRAALVKAQSHGTSAFDASGDLAGLECKGGQEWSAAPHIDDAGLDAVASIPEMTNVGGSTLSTDAGGRWLAEQTWFDGALTQGSAGGHSALFERPAWQDRLPADLLATGRRLTPEVSAVADPFTGLQIVVGGELVNGGGTSQAAPVWAGMAAVMNQYGGGQERSGSRSLRDWSIPPLRSRLRSGPAIGGEPATRAGYFKVRQ